MFVFCHTDYTDFTDYCSPLVSSADFVCQFIVLSLWSMQASESMSFLQGNVGKHGNALHST